MKAITKFFSKCSLWIIFGISFVIYFIIIYSMVYFITIDKDISVNIMLKLALYISFLFSSLIIITTNSTRKNKIFWNDSTELETLINNSDTITILEDLYNINIQYLIKISQGGIHSQEINRLISMIDIKIKTIKKLK